MTEKFKVKMTDGEYPVTIHGFCSMGFQPIQYGITIEEAKELRDKLSKAIEPADAPRPPPQSMTEEQVINGDLETWVKRSQLSSTTATKEAPDAGPDFSWIKAIVEEHDSDGVDLGPGGWEGVVSGCRRIAFEDVNQAIDFADESHSDCALVFSPDGKTMLWPRPPAKGQDGERDG